MVFFLNIVVNFGIFKPEKILFRHIQMTFYSKKMAEIHRISKKIKLQDLYIKFREVVKI
jgi:hypothetical protein